MDMQIIIKVMIFLGSALMVMNIIRFAAFMAHLNDVISSGNAKTTFSLFTGLFLLVFFLCGYLFTAFLGNPDLVMGGILFGGSIFVAIVLEIMFRLCSNIKTRTLEISEMLIGVIEARDPNLNGHSIYVKNLTMTIYKYLPDKIKKQINRVSLEYAALLHDVGKLGVPEAILNKPGKLTDEEWQIMRMHPKLGVKILSAIDSFKKICPWIEFHHERVDGKGYYGLRGDHIPVESRIIAVADTYSAIAMKRSYKSAKTYEEAVQIIKECSGTQFDPRFVEIFLKIPKAEVESCEPDVLLHEKADS